MVDCWPCQVAVTPILDRVRRPSVGFATRTPAGVSGLGGILFRSLSSRHRHTLLACAFTDCPLGYCLVMWADRPWFENRRFSSLRKSAALSNDLRRTGRNPLRSDRFLPYDRSDCQLNVTVRNSGEASERWTVSTSDGAYPPVVTHQKLLNSIKSDTYSMMKVHELVSS